MGFLLAYLRRRLGLYALGLLFGLVFAVTFWLFQLPLEAVAYPYLLCLLVAAVVSAVDFRRAWQRHQALRRLQTITDVLEQPLPEPHSLESIDYQDILRRMAAEHQRQCTRTNRRYGDMVDYYTAWAHQIKTPIASMRLNLNNEDSPLSRQLCADLLRVEQYVEMVLAFLRLDSASTDYVFRYCDLDAIVRQAVKRFSVEFIRRRLRLVYTPLNTRVLTDEKWLCFVLEQLLSNALKYTPSGSITIFLEEGRRLSIRDTGMGIAPEDLPRIFEKGYTGFNGRKDPRASGIGLYLCKRVCTNLGHAITARSQVDVGTTITLDLSRNSIEVE